RGAGGDADARAQVASHPGDDPVFDWTSEGDRAAERVAGRLAERLRREPAGIGAAERVDGEGAAVVRRRDVVRPQAMERADDHRLFALRGEPARIAAAALRFHQ